MGNVARPSRMKPGDKVILTTRAKKKIKFTLFKKCKVEWGDKLLTLWELDHESKEDNWIYYIPALGAIIEKDLDDGDSDGPEGDTQIVCSKHGRLFMNGNGPDGLCDCENVVEDSNYVEAK